MGQEIARTRFRHYDFHRFAELLQHEMGVLRQWFRDERFSRKGSVAGLELEAWLVDADGQPTPWNEQVISAAGSPDIVPELSRFNVEFNVAPRPLPGRGLAELAAELDATWRQCDAAANQLGTSVLAIGILPTITDSLLSLQNMSSPQRYHALNEQILRLRQGRPIRLNIQGQDTLKSEHGDVMLESATTSFQLHLQVPMQDAVRYYNAAIVASAPLVAIASNSPLLFGKRLWDETRIPLFEQATDIGGSEFPRVTLGSGYARESLLEIFSENAENYSVLLPLALENASERLAHLRLLNGTIWRWNRPLIGFDDDDTPHLRIEHRVMAAGPTLADMTANMALFYGLVESLAQDIRPPELCLPFATARENFYRAARSGLEANVQWLDGTRKRLSDLLREELLPRAAAGLERLEVNRDMAASWLGVIEARAQSGQTGAVWQRRFLEQHEHDFGWLTRTYRDLQQRGEPVHTWPIDAGCSQVSIRIPGSMLRVVNELPDEFLTARSNELKTLLQQPTLIHLSGRRPEPLFVSILLHGNEDVGLRAVQACLQHHRGQDLPRALSIFVGNVDAAQQHVRRLPHQPDYNRIWPGCEGGNSPEHALMRHVVAEMRRRNVFASVDLHNNTGWNPHYACVTRLDPVHLQLAALFGRTAVFFQRPRGVQTMAFAELCPSVTCECGKVGEDSGVRHAADFLSACLHLVAIPQQPPAAGDLHLFQTVATINLSSVRMHLTFETPDANCCPAEYDLALREDLEHLNFQELNAGLCLGWSRSRTVLPLTVTDQCGLDATTEFLALHDGKIQLRQSVIPAMLTRNEDVIRQDCLGYFMERFSVPESRRPT